MIEDLSRRPDWRVQVANTPAVITCTDVMAEEHPELVVAYMKAMVKVGHWANEHKRAAAVILNKQTFYLDAEDTYQGIKDVDMVPSLSAQNMACIKIGKDFMLETRLHRERLRCGRVGGAGVPGARRAEWLEDEWATKSWSKLPREARLRQKPCVSGNSGDCPKLKIGVKPHRIEA